MSSDKTKATNDDDTQFIENMADIITSDKEESKSEQKEPAVFEPPTFEGSGTEHLLQFNGYYNTSSKSAKSTFVNIQNRRWYGTKTSDKFYISYSLDGIKCTYLSNGEVTYDKTTNVATLKFKQGQLQFSRLPYTMVVGSNGNGCALTHVSGEISKKPVSGKNYLNFIPLHSFAGTYPFAGCVEGVKFKQEPTMRITKNNEWFFKAPKKDSTSKEVQVTKFNYYSSMFTLSNDIPRTESGSVMIFLGTGKSGLLAYMVNNIDSENYNFLLCDIATPKNQSDKAISSQQAAIVLAPFTGYYALKEMDCFFSIYTTIKYSKSNPSGEYEVTLTYCNDGKNVINVTNPTIFSHHDGHVTVQWRPESATDLVQIELARNKTYDPKTSVLTTLQSPGFLGTGINTTNGTPLSYFAAVYQYPTPLAGAKKVPPNVPILEITSNEKVFITSPSNGIRQEIKDFTYTGAMYLLHFKVDLFWNCTFMLGVGPNGLCAYGIVVFFFKPTVYFTNAIKPPTSTQSS